MLLDVSPTARWMKLNWHCTGYFRVNYPTKVWRELAFDLASDCTTFDPEDRAGLIDDAFSLAESGRLFYDVPLGIVSYLKFGQENHFLPFSIASFHLFSLYKRFAQTEMEFIYQTYIELLIQPYITDDIFEFDDSQSFLKKKLKVEVIKMACWVSHSDVLDKMSSIFQEWLNGEEPPYEIKEIVFKYAFSKTCGSEWEDTLNLAKAETEIYKRELLWAAVSSARDPNLISTVLTTLLEEDSPREEMFNVMKMVLNNPPVSSSVWAFLRENWEYVDYKFADKPHQLAIIVSDATRYFVLPSVLEQVRDFFCSQPSTHIEEDDKHSIMGHIKSNINWHLSHNKLISEWLHYFITSQWPVEQLI